MALEVYRGEIWLIDMNLIRGHEQAGTRPALVVSANPFNMGAADLVVVTPLTTRKRGIPLHVEVKPPEGGLKKISYVMCENIRSIAKERLNDRWGVVSDQTMRQVEERLRLLLEI